MSLAASPPQLYWLQLLLLSSAFSFLTFTMLLRPATLQPTAVQHEPAAHWTDWPSPAGGGGSRPRQAWRTWQRGRMGDEEERQGQVSVGDEEKTRDMECFENMMDLHPDESHLQRKYYHEMEVRRTLRDVKVPRNSGSSEERLRESFVERRRRVAREQEVVSLEPRTGEWRLARKWVSERELYPEDARGLGNVLREMSRAKVLRVMLPKEGQNYKVMMTLEGGQRVLFKPKLFELDDVEKPYPEDTATIAKERHYCTIAAFHLDRILGFRRSPLVVGRRLHFRRDLMPVAASGFFHNITRGAGGAVCFKIGQYEFPENLCTTSDGTIDGAVVLWLEGFPLTWRNNPWSYLMYEHDEWRNYTRAMYDTNSSYCSQNIDTFAKNSLAVDPLFLDLVDAAIYDLLLDNVDRHSFDVLKSDKGRSTAVLLIDNGSSMGNPRVDQVTTLAPLYQCCSLRRRTWQSLQLLADGRLSSLLRDALESDPLTPVLSDTHYKALDRRMVWVMKVIHRCFDLYSEEGVLVSA